MLDRRVRTRKTVCVTVTVYSPSGTAVNENGRLVSLRGL